MIDAECFRCGDQGPHLVTHDDGKIVTAVCRYCGNSMDVVLYDDKVSNYRAKEPYASHPNV